MVMRSVSIAIVLLTRAEAVPGGGLVYVGNKLLRAYVLT